ncbi:MAG: CvpA family protein [Kiloniellales bacterium]
MEAPPINVADVVIALVILVSGIFAFFRGFVHEMLAVVSWLGAALATLYGFPYVRPWTGTLITVPLIADMVAGVGIFLAVLILLSILTRVVSRRIRNSPLGPLDRSLGLVFGFLRGAAVVCVAWLMFAWLLPREDHPEWVTEAKARPLVEHGSAWLVSVLPERLRGQAGTKAEAAASKAETLRALEQSYQELLNPPTKDDAQEGEPGYNSRMREEMRRAIEGVTGSEEGAQ